MSKYRTRIINELTSALTPLGPIGATLDFGSGDGFFADQLPRQVSLGSVTPVDVVERTHSLVKPIIYAGDRLPFTDGQFELAYAIDVLHHCPDPMSALVDLTRCTSRYLLIKDHNQNGPIGQFVLSVLDEIGNRRFGIPSPYLYQHNWAWVDWLEQSQGFKRIHFVHPMPCHTGLLGLTNRLQFVGLWERPGA